MSDEPFHQGEDGDVHAGSREECEICEPDGGSTDRDR
jgi:hypothetical protein